MTSGLTLHFAAPWAFALLLPVAFAAWRMFRRPRRRAALPFAPAASVPWTTSWRVAAARCVPWMATLGAAFLVVAAARPQRVFSRDRKTSDAIAIAMVVDVSDSMHGLDLTEGDPLAPDAKDRLDVVKERFAEFIAKRPDDLIALVAFGGYATTRSPLTADHDALLQILKATTIPGEGSDGADGQLAQDELMTAIGDGLTTACARLKDAEPKTRIIVLLSDGVSNTGVFTPDFAADVAKGLGIKVYTIGVGTKNGKTPFRGRDMFGRPAVVYGRTEFDEEGLMSIAAKTGGKYFNVRDNDGFKAAMDDIDKLEKTEVSRYVYRRYDERYAPFLVSGAALASLAAILGVFAMRRPF